MRTPRRILLSRSGGDRATAYAMSNKIVRVGGTYVCTWLDAGRVNRWAAVDAISGAITRRGPIGDERADNHCGAALAATGDGVVHAVVGAHHGPFAHFALDAPDAADWRPVASIDARATYPSLVVDGRDRLHLAFRSAGDRWAVAYCRHDGDAWSPPRALVLADASGYVYFTNGLAAGAEERVHLVCGNTRTRNDGSRYHGASHLYSDDAGQTWCQYGRGALGELPARARDLALIEGDEDPDRVQSAEHMRLHAAPGPRGLNYQMLVLSNPVIGADGRPHVVLHNGLTGTAELRSLGDGGWRATPLTDFVVREAPGARVHVQSSLSRDASGALHAALMVEPTEECVWGAPGTHLVRIAVDGDRVRVIDRIGRDGADVAHWLPSLEHWPQAGIDGSPAFIYTCGRNAGGFENNRNALETDVWMALPGT